jgi:hypothetical protein
MAFLIGLITILPWLQGVTSTEAAGVARRGRSICAAARSHITMMEPQVRKLAADLDEREMHRRFYEGMIGQDTIYIAFPEQDVPTKVIQMEFPESLRGQVMKDVRIVKDIQRALLDVMGGKNVTGYNPFSLEFENALLFHPTCAEFMELNRALVHEHFAEAHTCHCNLFTVEAKKGNLAYGLHHASSIGFEAPTVFKRRWFGPDAHKSFHTAVTPTDINSSPFTMFDGVSPELFNTEFLRGYFRTYGIPELAPDSAKLVHAAAIAFKDRLVAFHHLRLLQDYLHAMYYYASQQCSSSSSSEVGTYWELQPGQALHFNNWRVHADNELGTDDNERVTIDLRCWSKMEIPFPFRNEFDFLRSVTPKYPIVQELSMVCLATLFNYSGPEEFLETIFSGQVPVPMSYVVGSIFWNYVNGGVYSLLHEDNAKGLRRHHSRVRQAYDAGGLNFDAFQSCYSKHRKMFEDPDKNIRIGDFSSPTEQAVSLLKLMVFRGRCLAGREGELFLMSLLVGGLFLHIGLRQSKP